MLKKAIRRWLDIDGMDTHEYERIICDEMGKLRSHINEISARTQYTRRPPTPQEELERTAKAKVSAIVDNEAFIDNIIRRIRDKQI